MSDEDFISAVRDEMAEIGATGQKQTGDQFAIWFMMEILHETLEDAKDVYHLGGSGDNKLDIGILDEDHDIMILAQCKFSERPLDMNFDISLPEEAKNARERLIKHPSFGNPKRKQFAARYNAQLGDMPERLLAVGFGSFSEDARKYAEIEGVELYDYTRLKGIYEISNQMVEGVAPPSLTLSVSVPDVIVRVSASQKVREFITVIRVGDIYDAVKQFRNGLFAENLRYKLTQKSKTRIGKKIQDTILLRPDELLLLNNGLTFVADGVTRGENMLILDHPQIVNGAQTSWAVFDAIDGLAPAHREAPRSAELLIKIVETTDKEIVEEIATATNQQNAISERDLKSNDLPQKEIGAAFNSLPQPVLYEDKEGKGAALASRQRGRFFVALVGKGKPSLRELTNEDAGQAYLAFLGLPYRSKQDKKLIFTSLYTPIFGVTLDEAVRFDALGLGRPDFRVGKGAICFTNDCLYAFSIVQLAKAISALYEQKLLSYEERKSSALSPKEGLAFKSLQDVGSYHKFWQYFLSAAICEITRSWAERRKESELIVRELVLGRDLDPFFRSLRQRQKLFNIETNLEHAYILDEINPSNDFNAIGKWTREISKKLNTLVKAESEKLGTAFRMQGFIDQQNTTYFAMRDWIRTEYTEGPKNWSDIFPLE